MRYLPVSPSPLRKSQASGATSSGSRETSPIIFGGRDYLGIEIGGTKLQLFVGDAEGGIVIRHAYTVDAAKGAAESANNLWSAFAN